MIRAALRSRTTWLALALLSVTGAHLWLWGRTDLTPTISLVDLEWTLVALVGAAYSVDYLRECGRNGRALNGDEADRELVERDTLIGSFMLGVHLFLLSLAALAVTAPTNPHPSNLNEARALGAGLTVLGEGLVVLLYVIRRKGNRIRQLLSL